MNIYSRQEFLNEYQKKNTGICEIYAAKDIYQTGNPHTDNLGSELEDKPASVFDSYSEDGMIKADFYVMEQEEYNTTIMANASLSFTDLYEENDEILIVVVSKP